MSLDTGKTDVNTELAGESTVDSPPSERDSDHAENGLDPDGNDGVILPGPTYNIDVPPDTTIPRI